MKRWLLFLLTCCLVAPALAAVQIENLPDELPGRYDLTWTLAVKTLPAAPLQIAVEQGNGTGYLLTITRTAASWQQVGVAQAQPTVSVPLALEAGKEYAFSLKRRPDTVALLLNHRRVFLAPAPTLGAGALNFTQVPAGVSIADARFNEVGRPVLGDDFMRAPDVRAASMGTLNWVEDPTWKCAFYAGKDNPITDPPKDPKTGLSATNPWQLSLYPVVETSTNGFWWLYRGTGRSWVVASDTQSYPTWDRYYVQSAVKTESDGEVGLIAAYQDNRNYLLFRWKQHDYLGTGKPRAELVAVIDGQEQVLADSTIGFDPGQWYTLRMNLGWRQVQVQVDGVELLRADNPGNIEGRVGLYANGAEHPRRLPVDSVTGAMYVAEDDKGRKINDAALEMRTTSVIYFDDVKVGEWVAIDNMAVDSSFTKQMTGKWAIDGTMLTANAAGRYVTGQLVWSDYITRASVLLKPGNTAGLFFHMDGAGSGYVWQVSEKGQALYLVQKGDWAQQVATSSVGVKAGVWTDLRIEADGAYVALYCGDQRVMDYYDETRTSGRSGLFAGGAGPAFRAVSITPPLREKLTHVDVHDTFDKDKWLAAWSTLDSEWYPANYEGLTPGAGLFETLGPSIPLPTDQPGLYWHKSGHYNDLRLLIPVTPNRLAGQTIHLASNYDGKGGYRLVLDKTDTGGVAKLYRQDALVGEYPFTATTKYRLSYERKGSYLLLYGETLDPDVTDKDVVSARTTLFCYRDAEPLKAEMVGVTVTTPALKAADVWVETEGYQDTFEQAPANWITESGIWAVMARYSCQPKWNWFGGFGGLTPTVWCKTRLDGDQTVEAYLGVKMQFDNAPEEYARRYRDLNVTICSDGAHLNSGYSLIRGGKPNGTPVTMLLRKGVVVATSTNIDHLLPAQNRGHRQWFCTRFEKRGGEIKVFLDNRLAMTYNDPEPLEGGYAGIWTLNNGLMIGRINISAARMSTGTPRAAAPIAVQDDFQAQPVPAQITVNGTPIKVASFETGNDGWAERPGITGRLVRVRTTEAAKGTNTFMRVVNSFPAGDFSVTAATNVDLKATPQLSYDYNFDSGVQVNMYVRKDNTWYEFLLTGKEGQEPNVYTVTRLQATADGTWRHLDVNLGQLLTEAITKHTGTAPADLTVAEIIFADWSSPADVRAYGFGANRGGMTMSFDNVAFLPQMAGEVTVAWNEPLPEADAAGNKVPWPAAWTWMTGVDGDLQRQPTTAATALTLTVRPDARSRFLHLQGKVGTRNGGMVTIPLVSAK